MARPLRIKYKGVFYHTTSRGNERRRTCFPKLDYGRFKEKGRGYHCQFVLIQGLTPFFYFLIRIKMSRSLKCTLGLHGRPFWHGKEGGLKAIHGPLKVFLPQNGRCLETTAFHEREPWVGREQLDPALLKRALGDREIAGLSYILVIQPQE